MNQDHRRAEPTYLSRLIARRRLLLVCGAGGVGKTTTSAALGIAAARAGRRVLVLTIDPARRLCEAMGLSSGRAEPQRLPQATLARLGAPAGATLGVYMLDATAVLDSLVRQCAPDQASLGAINANRLYGVLREVTLGVQEFAAAEAIYRLIEDPEHDLIVLDTPPARNALDFLDAPDKLSWLFNQRLIGYFLPSNARGFLRGKITNLIGTVFSRAFGEGFFDDLRQFLATVSSVFETLRQHAAQTQAFLRCESTAALLITSPDPAALEEAELLRRRLAELKLHCGGYVLNRSWAFTRGLRDPASIELAPDAPVDAWRSLAKLVDLGVRQRQWAERDRALLARLSETVPGGFAIATPHCGGAVDSLDGLGVLAGHLVQPAESEFERRACHG